jgi:alpha-beta hydrolase superfamily lysophospholipase
LSEHSNLGANMAKVLSENGFEVITFDLRGHGKSQGRRW